MKDQFFFPLDFSLQHGKKPKTLDGDKRFCKDSLVWGKMDNFSEWSAWSPLVVTGLIWDHEKAFSSEKLTVLALSLFWTSTWSEMVTCAELHLFTTLLTRSMSNKLTGKWSSTQLGVPRLYLGSYTWWIGEGCSSDCTTIFICSFSFCFQKLWPDFCFRGSSPSGVGFSLLLDN